MSDWPPDDENLEAEPGYDPWDAIDEALDAGSDPHGAHNEARRGALVWFLAESAESRIVYLRDYKREWEKTRAKRDRAAYMRKYRKRRKFAEAA